MSKMHLTLDGIHPRKGVILLADGCRGVCKLRLVIFIDELIIGQVLEACHVAGWRSR